MFVGNLDTDMWAAVSVKINPLSIRYANGLVIGIVPSKWNQEKTCQIKNGMVICPLLYDNAFMYFFYSAWRIISEFIKYDAKVPHERFLSGIEELSVAQYLEQNRERPVLELVDEDLKRLAHPTLLLPEVKNIITTDINNNFLNQDKTNSTIVVPNSILKSTF